MKSKLRSINIKQQHINKRDEKTYEPEEVASAMVLSFKNSRINTSNSEYLTRVYSER